MKQRVDERVSVTGSESSIGLRQAEYQITEGSNDGGGPT